MVQSKSIEVFNGKGFRVNEFNQRIKPKKSFNFSVRRSDKIKDGEKDNYFGLSLI